MTMLIEWVVTSVFLILAVLALRGVLKKRISACLRYALWAVVLVRLLVPVQLFTSPVAGTWVFAETSTEQNQTQWPITSDAHVPPGTGDVLAIDPPGGTVAGFPAAPQAPEPPTVPIAPAAPAAPDLSRLPVWLCWTWLAGSAVMALVFLVTNLRFARRLRQCRIPLEGADCPRRVYVAVGLPSPCLFGLLRPAVYVTPETAADSAMLRHVLAHEYTHFRHGDHIWSLLRCAALAAHWWNPLVWLAVALSRRDGELACDEGALRRLGDGERLAYGHTLLALVTAKPGPADLLSCATTMTGDKKSLMERVARVAKAPRRLLAAAIAAVLLVSLACACAFGRAAEPDPEPSETPDAQSGVELVFELDWENESGPVDVELPEYPGVVFRCGEYTVTAITEEGEQTLYGGMPICNVYLCDLTGDGRRELCSQVLFGSGATDSRIRVYDYGSQALYELENRMTYDYTLRLEGERLWAEERGYDPSVLQGGESYRAGPLVLTEHGLDIGQESSEGNEPGEVPAEVTAAAEAFVQEQYDYWQEQGASGQVDYDDWRILSLTGPWQDRAQGTDLELWRIKFELHTTTPEVVETFLAGGMYLTEDGWMCPTYPDCDYLVFARDSEGALRYLTSTMQNDTSPGGDRFHMSLEMLCAPRGAEAEIGQDFRYVQLSRGSERTEQLLIGPCESVHGGRGQRVEVQQYREDRGDWETIWSDEGDYFHWSEKSVFLCRLYGRDYLLRYSPAMGQGYATYSYQLFTLEDGQEAVAWENGVSFDISFEPIFHELHDFDPEAIADFMDEVNGLLAHSVQLINTDESLLQTFAQEGCLVDTLGFLDIFPEIFTRDRSKSLRDNLRDYAAAMEGYYYN